jgi:plastocyanin
MKRCADVISSSSSCSKTLAWIRRSFCLGVLPLLMPAVLDAATANVEIDPLAFTPDTVTINVNDQVVWTWASDFHSSTSDSGLWDSGIFNTGHVFTNTFATAGSFPYLCVVHGFTGTVNVQGGNTAPTVAITSPTNNASFNAPATIPIL